MYKFLKVFKCWKTVLFGWQVSLQFNLAKEHLLLNLYVSIGVEAESTLGDIIAGNYMYAK